MRRINSEDVSLDTQHDVVIKAHDRKRNQKMAEALERTLAQCSAIRSEFKHQASSLRTEAVQQGFEEGFRQVITLLVSFLGHYEQQQNERMQVFRESLRTSISESLSDPVIVERIIAYMEEACGQHKPVRIFVPSHITLPDKVDRTVVQCGDDNNITVQLGKEIIRFSSGSLVNEWLTSAGHDIAPFDSVLKTAIPHFYRDIATLLNELSENPDTDL
ncbi:type III secretion protein [Pantoea agglomerans]|uniref:type III secretion protein n=1 Tax=Enterobacter agglomerans TaxID=549 RepID=UPI0013B74174|nr:type III secretion protein [Pantoea agglomerans]NEG59868.1 type III secretion protein [Pantoea agglomerans]NEG98837.1 type III secretion protein [Pantoea agglomerans]NEH05179.1 type III secretion protein [Pantoea agglomerans]NEH16168.1 type III secretion protein [Pantoea agglomerans]